MNTHHQADHQLVASSRLVVKLQTGYRLPQRDLPREWPGETTREWGQPLTKSPEVSAKVDPIWQTLGL